MRAVVYLLALLAAIKIGTQEYLFRTSARDVIVAAYRERAIQACQGDAAAAAAGLGPAAWGKPAEIRLAMGKSDLDVRLWQVEHQLWNARFRNPYLLVTPAGEAASRFVCEYDVVHRAAQVQRL